MKYFISYHFDFKWNVFGNDPKYLLQITLVNFYELISMNVTLWKLQFAGPCLPYL